MRKIEDKPRPKKVTDMGHLGEGTQITTVQDKEIVLTASNGQHFCMKVADLAEAVRQVMPVATSDRNGMMSSSFFNSIYYTSSTIEPNSTLDTGVITGGLIMFQNASSVHEVGIGIMYADGNGKVICEAGSISCFGGNGILDVRKGGPNESIKVVNNASVRQVAILRIIRSYI